MTTSDVRKAERVGDAVPDAHMDGSGEARGERERLRRNMETERELLTLMEAEGVDEATRKRKLVGLFDRFRLEYTQLSVQLRESLRAQRKLMDKCLQMKDELVVCALKVRATQQSQLDEIKSLTFYRDECEHAWQQSSLSRERERDAARIIDELRLEVDKLQLQVKALVTPTAMAAALQRRQDDPAAVEPLLKPRSPLKVSPKTAVCPGIMSFDEWKAATRVWTPSMAGSPRAAATPTQASLAANARSEEVARCLSVPSLLPTPMERAVTAVAGCPRSVPKPRSSHGHRDEDGGRVTHSSLSQSPVRKAGRGLPSVVR